MSTEVRLMNCRWLVICIALVAGMATCVTGQSIPASSVDQILDGARSCIGSMSETALDQQKLKANGWQQGSMSEKGKPITDAPTIYYKGGLLMMIPQGYVATPLCMFSANITSFREFAKLQTALASAYGKPVRDDGKGEQAYLTSDNHIIDLASTGSQGRPAVRIAVAPVAQEKK